MEEEKFTDGFKSRIVEFARAQYDKGQNNFEMFCGIPIGSINGPKKNGMAAINLAKIAERCPELSLRWLLLGEGEMLERGGGAHLSSHSHIPGASASSGPPPPAPRLWPPSRRSPWRARQASPRSPPLSRSAACPPSGRPTSAAGRSTSPSGRSGPSISFKPSPCG